MGGSIWIESELGKGSTFAFTFKAAPATEPRSGEGSPLVQGKPDEEAPAETDSFEGLTILLAEDVEINREIVLALLEPTLLTIEVAENGAIAVEKFKAAPEKFNMIFMDVQMPEMDGFEATRRIRALEKSRREEKEPQVLKEIPIVAMTANVFREDVEKCLAAGMNGHVGKPLDINEVLRKLREYLPQDGGLFP
jgi:CheY-like chemotaxis protein